MVKAFSFTGGILWSINLFSLAHLGFMYGWQNLTQLANLVYFYLAKFDPNYKWICRGLHNPPYIKGSWLGLAWEMPNSHNKLLRWEYGTKLWLYSSFHEVHYLWLLILRAWRGGYLLGFFFRKIVCGISISELPPVGGVAPHCNVWNSLLIFAVCVCVCLWRI